MRTISVRIEFDSLVEDGSYDARVIVLSKEEAYSAFDMEQETPVFSPRFK